MQVEGGGARTTLRDATSISHRSTDWRYGWLYDNKGLALVETRGTMTYLKYYPAAALPVDAQSRFRQLFVVRNKWALSEIQPYIAYVTRIDGCYAGNR
jgi:hypothetical protein